MQTIHLNYATEDGKVFCKKENRIVSVDIDKCDNCPYLSGSLQGDGIECIWDDPSSKETFMSVYNPQKELLRVSKLIDNKKIKKG
jgi:WD40 repeat protein